MRFPAATSAHAKYVSSQRFVFGALQICSRLNGKAKGKSHLRQASPAGRKKNGREIPAVFGMR